MGSAARFLAAASIVACTAGSAAAQTERIAGTVTDPQGAPVAGAAVALTPAAGTRVESRTDERGGFSFDRVATGTFVLEVDAPGFARWRQSLAASAATTPLDVTLTVADLREAIDVFGTASATLDTPTQVGSRLDLTALETPASVFLLSGQAVRDRGAPTVVDAKARAVGVTIRANPGNGFNGLAVRGFDDSGSVMQLFDGELMLVGASTVTFPFDPWMVERIEVLNGPASVLHGNGAIGGVVNVVPRRPGGARETTMRIGAGSFNTWRGAVGTGGAMGARTSYRVDASANRSSGWLKETRSDATAVSAAVRHQFRPNLALAASYDFGYQRPGEYFGTATIDGAVADARREVNYNVADSDIWFRDNWTQARLEWQVSPTVRIRNGARVLAAGRHFRDVEQYVFNAASGLVDRSSYFEAFHRQRQYGDRTDVAIVSRPFGRSNTLTAGVDYNFVSFQHTNNSPYGGASTTDLQNSTPGTFINLAGTLPKYRSTTHHTALFVEDRFALAPKISIVAGMRVDRYAVDRRNLLDDSTVDRKYTPVSWRSGVVYSVTPELSVYGQFATATDTIRNVISSTPAQLLFDPTVGRQVEGGVKQSLRDRSLEWTVAGYAIRKEKLLVPVPGRPGVLQQVGAQSSRGVEATAAVNLPVGLRIEGNLALLDARFDDFSEAVAGAIVSREGNTPPSVPERAINLWLTWAGPQDWQFRGGLRSVGRRYWDNANTSAIPGYTVVDAGIRRRLTDTASVDLFLFNLTNELYATDFYFNAFAPQWMLGAPRSAEVALTLAF